MRASPPLGPVNPGCSVHVDLDSHGAAEVILTHSEHFARRGGTIRSPALRSTEPASPQSGLAADRRKHRRRREVLLCFMSTVAPPGAASSAHASHRPAVPHGIDRPAVSPTTLASDWVRGAYAPKSRCHGFQYVVAQNEMVHKRRRRV